MIRLFLLIAFLISSNSFAKDWRYTVIPRAAYPYIPQVIKAQHEMWPNDPYQNFIEAMIEQETCLSPTHYKCWNPKAELKTSREDGFGIGQITIAYLPNGVERFNNFKEAKKIPGLQDWKWEQRYDIEKQLKVIVWNMKANWNKASFAKDQDNRYAFALVAYNSGLGGLHADRILCQRVVKCDPNTWWKNVEMHSTKSKKVTKGYGSSFFTISREYPENIMHIRAAKYQTLLNEQKGI